MDLSQFNPGSIIALVVGLSLAPFVAVMVTSFTKLVVVFSLLRNALGLQQTPPNLVLNGLSIILSLYIMYPVINQTFAIAERELAARASATLTVADMGSVLSQSKEPLREFLQRHASPQEREFFYSTLGRIVTPEQAAGISENDLMVIIPAFTVSELTAAFKIGFLIFLPFLIIDLIVANLLLALGMMMLPPSMVSLPFKLLLFVVIDGWTRLVHGLVLSYT